MNEQLENSDSHSMDRNIHIQANKEGEGEIYIPYWDEEGSSSPQLNHLMEEVKILKNKCRHLETHLEENHRQFSSLNQLYLIAEANQRKLLKENDQIRKKYLIVSTELGNTKVQLENTAGQMNICRKRENELKQQRQKYKENEMRLLLRIQVLQKQNQNLKKQQSLSPINIGKTEEEKWKKQHYLQIKEIQVKWKSANEKLEQQCRRIGKDYNDKNEQIKSINKVLISYKENAETKIKALEREIQHYKQDISKGKKPISDLERQLKDLRDVLEDVSRKNDELECDNQKIKTKLQEEANRSSRLVKQYKEFENEKNNYQKQIQNVEKDRNLMKKVCSDLKLKCSLYQSEISQLKITIQQLKSKIQSQKRKKENQMDIQAENVQKLQEEYERELIALKRLINYKQKKPDDERKYENLKKEYKQKFELMVKDYKAMQEQMFAFKQQTLIDDSMMSHMIIDGQQVNMNIKQELWRKRLLQLTEERQILIDKVTEWQIKYEELRCLFEAKIESKQEIINLLHVKMSNIEMRKYKNACNCTVIYQR